MNIAGRQISSKLPPYIVAEISCNHLGILENAYKLMEAAKTAGADAAKFQCYEADDLTIDCNKPEFIIKDGPWTGRALYELYAKAGTPRNWFPALFAYGKAIGITTFASVFSPEAVDFLEKLDCPAYKIASMEITDIPLIQHAAKTGKPLIISTGMANDEEIFDACDEAEGNGLTQAIFLHCISGYPTPIEESNLRCITDWRKRWGKFGISDHTQGWEVPVAATALGATIIEKHLMLHEPYRSEDFPFSMWPETFREMCKKVRAIWQAMQPSERKSEEPSRQLRRSLYVVKDIKQGQQFTSEHVRSIRPSYGMPPKALPMVLKSFAACDIERGTALEEGLLLPF